MTKDSFRGFRVLRKHESIWNVSGLVCLALCCVGQSKKWTIDELTASRFPHKVSNDIYRNPWKSDIALSRLENDVYEIELEEEAEQEHGEELAKNATQLNTKRRHTTTTKQDRKKFRYRNRKRHLGKNRRKRSTKSHDRPKRAATANLERLWDNAVIPYEIDSIFTEYGRALFREAMRYWESYTCIQFVEREDHPDYIVFTQEDCGCCSYIGKTGRGPQGVSIAEGCDSLGNVLHELGHVVGFHHEHSRPDRDEYVQIIDKNIRTGKENNFKKLTEKEVDSLGSPYDYASIMHYSRSAFPNGTGLDSILPHEGLQGTRPEIGQRNRLSEEDIAQTNLLYKCPKCGKTLQNSSGTFSPPDYGSSSPPDGGHCEWRITATQGERIILNITDTSLLKSENCETDYLEVRDGYWYKSPLLGKFCDDTKVPIVLSSSKERMLVTYRTSPNNVMYQGFKAHYESICGGDFVQKKGTLRSPNYPETYPAEKECTWRITVPENYVVTFKFKSFEIEHSDTCSYDYLEIRDGHESTSPLLGLFCGYNIHEDILSSGNKVTVKFVSDGTIQRAGFAADYINELDECKGDHGCEHECINTIGGYKCECRTGYELHSNSKNCEDACGGVIEKTNGTIISPSFPDVYPPNKNCIWEIKAPPKHKITLNFTHFDLEENHQGCKYDSLEIRSKTVNDKDRKFGVFCGSSLPPVITTESNYLRIEFRSDENIQKSGFGAFFFTDEDECATYNDGCQHICSNLIGSYVCSCYDGYVLHANLHNCEEDSCGSVINETNGTITSPSFPEPYPPHKLCIWEIIAPPQQRITLNFTNFDLEEDNQGCQYDSVDISSKMADNEVRMHGVFCGSSLPPIITSEDNSLRIKFLSDGSIQNSGFVAFFFTDTDECATNNGGCQHICNNTIGSYICSCRNGYELHENLHDCEDTDECATNNGGCQHICNNTIGSYVCSCRSGYELRENLHDCEDIDECAMNNGGCQHICSNTIGSYICSCLNEYKLDENLHDCEVSCGGVIQEANGTIFSPLFPDLYPPNKTCIWEIIVPPHYRITLNFIHFDVQGSHQQDCEYDSVNITSKIADDEGRMFGVFCGSKLPPLITYESNYLRIEFSSDNSVQKSGFGAFFFSDLCDCGFHVTAFHTVTDLVIARCAKCDLKNGFSRAATFHLSPFQTLTRLAFHVFLLYLWLWH